MNNSDIEKIIENSLKAYANLENGSRSNEKLKVLHEFIKIKLDLILNNSSPDDYVLYSLTKNKSTSKEMNITGKYFDKKVDIAIFDKNKKELGGVAIKFPISNIDQNLNNYFENMLGETANIRTNNKKYFQIMIFPIEHPYFFSKTKNKKIKNINKLNKNKMEKYIKISWDDPEKNFHIPNKILIIFYEYIFNWNNIKNEKKFKETILEDSNNFIKLRPYISQWNINSNILIENDLKLFLKEIKKTIQ